MSDKSPSETPYNGLPRKPTTNENRGGSWEKPPSKISPDIANPPHSQNTKTYWNKCYEEARNALQNMKWFSTDPNRALATFTFLLVLIGLGALFIQRDTEERQLRAYISIEPYGPIENFTETTVAQAKVRIRNSGQTPAHHLITGSTIDFGPYPLPPKQTFHLNPPTEPPSVLVLNPTVEYGGTIIPAEKPYSATQIASVKNGNPIRLYVFGTVTYRDVFGTKHYSNYCFSYFGVPPQLTNLAYCSERNDAD